MRGVGCSRLFTSDLFCSAFRSPTGTIGETTINKSPSFRLRLVLTLCYLLTIYATLGIARPIAEHLRSSGFLVPVLAIMFVVCTALALGWRYRTTDKKRMVLRGFLIISLLAVTLLIKAMPEERLHFLTYGLLGWLICWTIEAHPSAQPGKQYDWLLPCLLAWLAGTVDELIQWWLPVRVFDIRDIIFNGVAGMLGIALFATGSKRPVVPESTDIEKPV